MKFLTAAIAVSVLALSACTGANAISTPDTQAQQPTPNVQAEPTSSPSVDESESTPEPTEEATPEPEASVVKVREMVRACSIYDTVQATVIVELHNEGSGWAKLGGGDYTIYDEDENVLGTGGFTYSYPQFLAPGATGYLAEVAYLDDAKAKDVKRVEADGSYDDVEADEVIELVDGEDEAQARGVRRRPVHYGYRQQRVVRGHNQRACRLHLPERERPADRVRDDELGRQPQSGKDQGLRDSCSRMPGQEVGRREGGDLRGQPLLARGAGKPPVAPVLATPRPQADRRGLLSTSQRPRLLLAGAVPFPRLWSGSDHGGLPSAAARIRSSIAGKSARSRSEKFRLDRPCT